MSDSAFQAWCIVELMGHVTLAGYVSETEIGGGKLFKIDVPESNAAQKFTSFFGAASVYKMTPVDEATVMTICKRRTQVAFSSWELQQAFDELFKSAAARLKDEARAEVRRELPHTPDPDKRCDECGEREDHAEWCSRALVDDVER